MDIKEFLVGMVKKVISQKIPDSNGEEKTIDKIALQILTNKAVDYISKGEKNVTAELILDRFVPREVRKLIQTILSVEDKFREIMFRFADTMNDDGLKEKAFILAMGAAKKVTTSLDKTVDDTINRIKLSTDELANLKEEIEKEAIRIASDDQPLSNIKIDVGAILKENDGFEAI